MQAKVWLGLAGAIVCTCACGKENPEKDEPDTGSSSGSSSSSNQDPCHNVTCQEWETCVEGTCSLSTGRCINYTHCAQNMFCDAQTHRCRGPTQPPDSWLTQLSGDQVTLQFTGRINSDEDVRNGSPTMGEATARFSVGDHEATLDEYAYIYQRVMPDPYPTAPDLAGKNILGGGISKLISNENNTIRFWQVKFVIPVDALMTAKAADTPELALPPAIRTQVNQVEGHPREWDRADFRRSCIHSTATPSAQGGALFVPPFGNAVYAAGENIELWARIPMGLWVEISEDNEENLCTFTWNGQPITRAQYRAELAKTEPTLSCTVPDHFMDPVGDTTFTAMFIGFLNAKDTPFSAMRMAYGDTQVSLGGTQHVVDDYAAYVVNVQWEGKDYVNMVIIGSLQATSNTHYTFKAAQALLPISLLERMKQNGQPSVTVEPGEIRVTVDAVEEKVPAPDKYYERICPLAVLDEQSSQRAVLACLGQNTTFAPGEPLEMLLNVALTTHPDTLASYNQINPPAPCYCVDVVTSQSMDCAGFDQL